MTFRTNIQKYLRNFEELREAVSFMVKNTVYMAPGGQLRISSKKYIHSVEVMH